MACSGAAGTAGAAGAARLSAPAREFCHDLLQGAATIGLLARAADVEADPSVPPESQLRRSLREMSAAAGQIAAICEQVLRQPDDTGGSAD